MQPMFYRRRYTGFPVILLRVLLFWGALLGMGLAASAQKAFESAARNAILIDASSGDVLYEKNADAPIEPASMSKLMTMTLVFEALSRGEITLQTEYKINEDAWRRGGALSGGSTMYAELNSKVAVADLIRGAIIQSANDACIILAAGLAGSEQTFVTLMNDRARALGLKQSTFRNATGLPAPEHVMSVRDLTILARNIIKTYPEYYNIYSERSFTWNKIKQANRNPLLTDYPGADGMTTGYTDSAGYGLVGSAFRENRRLIVVVAGLKTIGDRRREAQALLDWGFEQFKPFQAFTAGETVTTVRVWGGTASSLPLVAANKLRLALSEEERAKLEVSLVYRGPLLAPVKAGEKLGEVRFVIDGGVLAVVPVQAGASVDLSPSLWGRAFDTLKIMALGG